MSVVRSVSTWQQPSPPPAGPVRAAVVERVVDLIDGLAPGRLRVAVDGRTGAGKTTFGHELAEGLARRGRTVLRASLDDFKRPWRDRHLYDRESGEGYYRNAYDFDAIRTLLLDPDGEVALCSIDPLTQVDHSAETVPFPDGAVLVVDTVFACRPELDDAWDLRIWLDVDAELSLRRGAARDDAMYDDAEALHRDRYGVAEEVYLAEVDPLSFVEVVVDNRDLERPLLVRP